MNVRTLQLKRVRISIIFVAVFVLYEWIPSSAQTPVVSLDSYIARLSEARSLALAASRTPSPEMMQRVREQVGYPLVVEAKGETVAIANDRILSGLQGRDRTDFLTAAARLESLAGQATELRQDALPREQIAAALSNAYVGIRSRSTFTHRFGRVVQAIIAGIAETIVRFLGTTRGAMRAVTWVALAALVFIIFIVALKITRRIRLVGDVSEPLTAGIPQDVDWRARAEIALERGEGREAIRNFFRAILQLLASKGVIDDDPSMTAGECRRAVRAIPRLSLVVEQAAAIFELVTYGETDPTTEHLEMMRQAESEVRAAA